MPSLSFPSTSSWPQLHLVPGRSLPEKLEAVHSGQNIQFCINWVRGTQTQVVRGGSQVALGLVAGVIGMDMCAMVGGKVVDHSLSASNCTVSFFSRLRGGSRDNVPGQWTCSFCFAERCWPVRVKCYRCGSPRQADPIPFNDKKRASSRPHVVPRVEAIPRQEWEILLHPLLRLVLSLLKTWSRHSCSSRMS